MSICLFVCSLLAMTLSSFAQDRVGAVGQSISLSKEFKPVSRWSETYNMDFGFSYSERWWGLLSWEMGLNHSERINLAFGTRWYMLLHRDLKPYVGAFFLYSVNPKNNFGWRAGVGMDYDLHRLTGSNNLRFELFSGASSYIFLHTADIYTMEVARMGFSWSY